MINKKRCVCVLVVIFFNFFLQAENNKTNYLLGCSAGFMAPVGSYKEITSEVTTVNIIFEIDNLIKVNYLNNIGIYFDGQVWYPSDVISNLADYYSSYYGIGLNYRIGINKIFSFYPVAEFGILYHVPTSSTINSELESEYKDLMIDIKATIRFSPFKHFCFELSPSFVTFFEKESIGILLGVEIGVKYVF